MVDMPVNVLLGTFSQPQIWPSSPFAAPSLEDVSQMVLRPKALLYLSLKWVSAYPELFPSQQNRLSLLIPIILAFLWVLWFRARNRLKDGQAQARHRTLVHVLAALSLYPLLVGLAYGLCFQFAQEPLHLRGFSGLTLPLGIFWDGLNALCAAFFAGLLFHYAIDWQDGNEAKPVCGIFNAFPVLFVFYFGLAIAFRVIGMLPTGLFRANLVSASTAILIQEYSYVAKMLLNSVLFLTPAILLSGASSVRAGLARTLWHWKTHPIETLAWLATLTLIAFCLQLVLGLLVLCLKGKWILGSAAVLILNIAGGASILLTTCGVLRHDERGQHAGE